MSVTPTKPFQINSVRLQNAHVRIIRGVTEDDPPFQTQNLIIWENDASPSGSTTPATIPLSGATLIINLISNGAPSFDFILEGTVQGRKISASQRTAYNPGTASVEVTVTIPPSTVPWACKETILWTSTIFSGSETWTVDLDTPVQLYAVSSEMAPMYAKEGIPEDMLDLFVDQYPGTASSSIADWITWVVKRCHASTTDQDPKLANQQRIHGYYYNVYTGAPRFTSGIDYLRFDLLNWLKFRQAQHSSFQNVNCYDQASIVVSALNLGLSYYLRDQNGNIVTGSSSSGKVGSQVTTIQRFFKGTYNGDNLPKRFGYINQTDLVGWGECNSPFFAGNENKKIINDGVKTAGFADRTSFANHYFVCYNTLDSQGVVVQNALDACAGPAAELPNPLNNYLTNTIDEPASIQHNGDSWSLTAIAPVDPPTNTFNVLSLFNTPDTSKYETYLLFKTLNAEKGREVSNTPIGASFTNLSGFLGTNGNVTIDQMDIDIAKNRSTISYTFSHTIDNKSVGFATAIIDVMKDFPSARFQAMDRVYALERSWVDVFAAPKPGQFVGDVNLVAKGNLNAAVIIYGNVAMYLEGDTSTDAFNALVKSIDAYMTTAKTAPFTLVNSSSLVITMPATVPIGTPFEIDITAPGMTTVEVEWKSESVHITKGPYEVPGGGWKVNCTAFETGNYDVAFGFAQNGTYYPNTDKTQSIAVTSPNLISNGDFQTGVLAPWTVDVGRGTMQVEKGGFNNAQYKVFARVPEGDGAYSASSLQQTLQTMKGKTYRISVQFSFGHEWITDCYLNIFVNGKYVYSKQSGVAGLIEESNTFMATSDQSVLQVGLLATDYNDMTFELGYVKLELVP